MRLCAFHDARIATCPYTRRSAGRPDGYREFAESYYEVAVALGAVAHIFSLGPLTDEIVAASNPDLGLADLAADIDEIDYSTTQMG